VRERWSARRFFDHQALSCLTCRVASVTVMCQRRDAAYRSLAPGRCVFAYPATTNYLYWVGWVILSFQLLADYENEHPRHQKYP
jgi:hypothetical protein